MGNAKPRTVPHLMGYPAYGILGVVVHKTSIVYLQVQQQWHLRELGIRGHDTLDVGLSLSNPLLKSCYCTYNVYLFQGHLTENCNDYTVKASQYNNINPCCLAEACWYFNILLYSRQSKLCKWWE